MLRLKILVLNRELQKISFINSPGNLHIIDSLWWRFVPGEFIKVRWPSGTIIAGPGPKDPRWFD